MGNIGKIRQHLDLQKMPGKPGPAEAAPQAAPEQGMQDDLAELTGPCASSGAEA